ncbi:MAG: cell division protein FtsH, partial [Spirochaetes bacterium]|nr:cell division protein FtsH [Spirochaetota bacterium]
MQDNNQDNNGNHDPGPPKFNLRNNRFAFVFLMIIMGMFMLVLFQDNTTQGREIPYSQFLGYLSNGEVESVEILDQYEIQGTLKNRSGESRLFMTNIPYFDDNLVAQLRENGVRFSGSPKPMSPLRIFLEMLPWVILFLFVWFMFRQI